MTRFTTVVSKLLYILLIAIVGFVTIVLTITIVAVISNTIWPGSFGTVHANRSAVDLTIPGNAPAMIAVLLLAIAMVAGALLPLVGMLRSTAAGDPFVPANVRRLHIIAATIAAGLVAQIVLPRVLPEQIVPMIQPIDIGGFVFALLLTLVLAEVFREGVRLRDDVELTV